MKKYQVFDEDNTGRFYYAAIVETHEGELWGYADLEHDLETLWIIPKGKWSEVRLVIE